MSTGSFTKTKAVINANKEYAKRNNPVLEFLEDLENGDIKNDVDITAGTDITVIPANKVFEYYKNWCFHSNYKAVGRNEFYRLVQLEGYDKKRVKKEGERESIIFILCSKSHIFWDMCPVFVPFLGMCPVLSHFL